MTSAHHDATAIVRFTRGRIAVRINSFSRASDHVRIKRKGPSKLGPSPAIAEFAPRLLLASRLLVRAAAERRRDLESLAVLAGQQLVGLLVVDELLVLAVEDHL